MDAQNLRIEELLQKIKQQQYKLDKQNLQIKSLQSKVSPCPVLQPPAWPYMLWVPWCDTPAVPALVAVLVLPGLGHSKGATALVPVLQGIISTGGSSLHASREFTWSNSRNWWVGTASLGSAFAFICRIN